MRDREIAASLAAGDPGGLAAAYDRHAAGLYGYCRSLLGDPSDAADAVQDTFIIAAAKLDGLRSQARLRPWLYAVARNEGQSRLHAGAWPAQAEAAGELAVAPEAADTAVDRGSGELRYLILDAISRLNPAEREAAELSRRHGLDHGDLAAVLGIPVSQARALAAGAGDQLDRSLGTLLVASTGWGRCPGLDALLDGWDGRPTLLWRTRAGRHINGCPVCGERRREVLSPAMWLSLLPLPLLPGSLREHVLWLVPDGSPEAASYRGEVVGRTGPFDLAGFPVQIAPAGWAGRSGRPSRAGRPAESGPGPGRRGSRDRPGRRRLAVAAVLLILAAGGGVAAIVGHSGGPGRTAADAVGTGAPFLVPGAPASGGPAHPGSPAPDPGRAIPGRPSPSPGSSAPGGQEPPPASSAPVTPAPPTAPPTAAPPEPAPPPPVLSESPGTVSMAESETNIWTGSFTLSAARGPIAFSVSAPSGVSVSRPSGTVSPGSPVTISVTYTLPLLAAFPSSLAVNGMTVGLSFQK